MCLIDWSVLITDTFKARHMRGDGVIEIRRFREAVKQAGYHGPIEEDIMNQGLRDQPGDEVLSLIKIVLWIMFKYLKLGLAGIFC